MDNVKRILSNDPYKVCYLGLKSCTLPEIDGFKVWLREKGIKFTHKSEGLPFNGVLYINTSVKKLPFTLTKTIKEK